MLLNIYCYCSHWNLHFIETMVNISKTLDVDVLLQICTYNKLTIVVCSAKISLFIVLSGLEQLPFSIY